MVTIDALNNYLTVEMMEEPEPDYGDLILADSAKKVPRWATVLSVGAGAPDIDGSIVPLDVVVGETVYVNAHGKEEIDTSTVGGTEKVTACSVLDVLGKLDTTTMEFTPLGSFVVIEKLTPPDMQGGIALADSRKQAPNIGIVRTLGMGWKTPNGREVPFQVKVGDTVAFLHYNTVLVDMSQFGFKEPLHLVQHGDILGRVNI